MFREKTITFQIYNVSVSYLKHMNMIIIIVIIIITSYAPISSKIKLSGAAKPRG